MASNVTLYRIQKLGSTQCPWRNINLFEKDPKNVFFFGWYFSSQKYKNKKSVGRGGGGLINLNFKIGHENLPKSRVRIELVSSFSIVMQFLKYLQIQNV